MLGGCDRPGTPEPSLSNSNLAATAGRNLEADPKSVTRGPVRKHRPHTLQLRPGRLACQDL